jgi:hypothetical protein
VRTLFVAAGGGGDAVAALLVRRLLAPDEDGPALVSTCAWERLRIDPVPGPRRRTDFQNLAPLAGVAAEVTDRSDTLPPGRSSLPRVAAEGFGRVLLHDFEGGAVGLAAQLTQLVSALEVDRLTVVDVGGDIVARGPEPTLLSPLGDSLTLAACFRLGVPTTVAIVGPGVDGELPTPYVYELLQIVGATLAGSVGAMDVDPIRPVLSWHPTEATTIVAAAALGARGAVEMRRGGPPVAMDASSAEIWTVKQPEPQLFPIARALMQTTSLANAEDIVCRIAVNELDYERARAGRHNAPEKPITIRAFADASRAAGATHATTRRLLEATGTDPSSFSGARVDGLGLWALDHLAVLIHDRDE